jgi:hypothetical protein
MSFRRVFAAASALALAAAVSVPANAQDKQPAPEQQQRKLSNDERKEYIALNELVDAVMAGKQPAPADVKLKFQNISSGRPRTSMSVHARSERRDVQLLPGDDVRACGRKGDAAAAPAAAGKGAEAKAETKGAEVNWPFADVYFLTEKNLTTVGDVSELGRALELPPGEYTLYIAMRERQPKDASSSPSPWCWRSLSPCPR